jgi:DNA-directed RNA polymerase subunit RPC12/RpoP
MHEKDPFGDKLREKERADEDRYFAERDRALLEKIRLSDEAGREAAAREVARGRCPRCGTRLTPQSLESVDVNTCPACGGLWLDKGDLAAVSGREQHSWLSRFFRQSLGEIR